MMPMKSIRKNISPPQVVLHTDRLTKRYGDLTAVDNLSLEIFEGEVFGFLGPNGAGKTTAVHMMCGILKPDGGTVLFRGQEMRDGGADVRAKIGVCPQEIVLWNTLTCLEQLEFIGVLYGVPKKLARRRGAELLEAMGLSEKRDKTAKTLSGGMKRRLNMIMALVHDPEVVILDEPEAGLDPQSRVLVREYIRSLAEHKTVILTTHNMDEADRLADRVAILDGGKLLQLDSPEVLKRRIGEGDVLEIEIPGGDKSAINGALRAVKKIMPHAAHSGNVLTLRSKSRDGVKSLGSVLQVLKKNRVPIGEVRLRQNSLEDVFISLTGRRLRE
jgi:ABC-2 type transport system ATP-binding protein